MTNHAATFSPEAREALAAESKIGLLATVDESGSPHVTLITSLMAPDPERLVFGEFCVGRSKAHLVAHPEAAWLVMTLDRKLYQGRARWKAVRREGPELERLNRQPMFRYNAYTGVYAVHYLDLLSVKGPSPLPVARLLAGTAVAQALRLGPAGARAYHTLSTAPAGALALQALRFLPAGRAASLAVSLVPAGVLAAQAIAETRAETRGNAAAHVPGDTLGPGARPSLALRLVPAGVAALGALRPFPAGSVAAKALRFAPAGVFAASALRRVAASRPGGSVDDPDDQAGSHGSAEKGPSDAPLKPWAVDLINHPATLRFLAAVGEDGAPRLHPLVPAVTPDGQTLRFVVLGDAWPAHLLPETEVALFALNLKMQSVLTRGRLAAIHHLGPLTVGELPVEWVYNTMPPLHGQIYPPRALEPILVT